MCVETPLYTLMFVTHIITQTEKFVGHACHTTHWLEPCGLVSGFASYCMSVQDDASKLSFVFKTQWILQSNTSPEEPEEG